MNESTLKKPGKNKFLTIFVCIFLAFVIALGGVFVVIRIVKERTSVAKYDGVYLDEGAARYLASYYKYLYIKELKSTGGVIYDSPYFWEQAREDGITEGEALKNSFSDYIASLLASVKIYDSAFSFSRSERVLVESRVEAVLNSSIARGSVEEFNRQAASLGFDYDDFLSAAKYLYKASAARYSLYGAGGEGIKDDKEACEAYLSTYSHVDVIFIRLEDTYVLDQTGEYTYDEETGERITRPLTETESAERRAAVDNIRTYISEGRMTTESFDHYLKYSEPDHEKQTGGYYLNKSAANTREFGEDYPEIVDAAMDMSLGEFRAVDCEHIGGVAVIFKYDLAEGAYASEGNIWFSDFYQHAAEYDYLSVITDLITDVEFTDSYADFDIVNDYKKIRDDFIVGAW